MGVNLISSTSLVQTPYVTVTIGKYKFGCYNPEAFGSEKFPNYINSLKVTKINGKVNTYTLIINYPITESSDPNFFEKVISSVSRTREIEFTYGDLSATNFIYKNEKALITGIQSSFSVAGSIISYTITAVSNGILGVSGSYTFPASRRKEKPSTVIKRILQNKNYGLQDIFTGMRDISIVDANHLLGDYNDVEVELQAKTNISVLDYLSYLVECMTPSDERGNVDRKSFYIMNFVDDTSGKLGGPYFKISKVDRDLKYPEAYDLYIGYPTINCVSNFQVSDNQNYAIFFDYQEQIHPEKYVKRINSLGEWEDVYAPPLSSGNEYFKTTEKERAWWTKTSQFPVTASVDIKGLLRPAMLMSYVHLYVYFYGKLHIHSGTYIVTKQEDSIDMSGYKTTLSLTKISNDDIQI